MQILAAERDDRSNKSPTLRLALACAQSSGERDTYIGGLKEGETSLFFVYTQNKKKKKNRETSQSVFLSIQEREKERDFFETAATVSRLLRMLSPYRFPGSGF